MLCFFPLYPATTVTGFLWTGVLLVTLWRFVALMRDLWIPWPSLLTLTATHARTLAFLGIVLLHLTVWYKVAWPVCEGSRDYLLTGDQPSYLFMAESIVHDFDLDVSNNTLPYRTTHYGNEVNHAGGAEVHNSGIPRESPEFQKVAAAFGAAKWSVHRCGTSVLISPTYWLGGVLGGWERRLITLFLLVVVAAAIGEIVLVACALGVVPWAALSMGMGVGLCVPVVCNSTAIYPEVFMFFIMARLLRIAVKGGSSWRYDLETGLLFAVTPWLQDKYGVWALPFLLARLLSSRKSLRVWLVMLALPFLSGVLMAKHNLFLYGRILPRNSLGSFLSLQEALQGGLPGTWFDWGYGLAVLAPYVFLLVGGLIVWKRSKTLNPAHNAAFWSTLAVIITGWLVIGMWWCWYGGFAPPNRFMLTLVPLVAVAAMLATQALERKQQISAIMLWILSMAMGLECLFSTDSWYSLSHPATRITHILGLQCLAVTYRFASESLQTNVAVTVAGLILFGLFAYGGWRCTATHARAASVRLGKIAGLGVVIVLIACAMAPGLGHPPIRINYVDIPTEVGVLKSPRLQSLDSQRCVLDCDLVLLGAWQSGEASAFAVHYLDRQGRIISQKDFNLVHYVEAWMRADVGNRDRFAGDLTIPIHRQLSPPPGTVAIRIGLYDGASGKSYHNQWRHKSEVLALAPR